MRVLVTRPIEDAEALVTALAARGHEAMVEPMLEIAPAAGLKGPLDLAGVQAVLFTSANGVRAFARLSDERRLPALCVGAASAAAAQAAGFVRGESAEGDVEDLARLAVDRLDPADGALFHGAGSALAGDLKGALEAAGFAVRRVALYDARPPLSLSAGLRAALIGQELDAATFFSPRTAETFVRLIGEAGLARTCAGVAAVCLSEAVADQARALPWRRIGVAARPDQDALLACLDDIVAGMAATEGTLTDERTPQPEAAEDRPAETGEAAAHRIIAGFGGIRPMASKLGIAVSTVQGWRERGSIPSARHAHILSAAEAHGIELDRDALSASGHETATAPAPEAATGTADSVERPDGKPPGEAEAPPPAAPARPAGAGRAWVGGFVLGALVLAAGAGGAVLTRDLWLPQAAAPAPAEDPTGPRLAGIEERLAALEAGPAPGLDELRRAVDGLRADLAATSERLGAMPGLVERSARLEQAVTALGGRIETVSDDAARAARIAHDLTADLAEVKTRLGALAETGAETRTALAGETGLMLAILQLRDALRGGAPFEAELQTFAALAAEAPDGDTRALAEEIAVLQPHAAGGVPTLVALKGSFPAAARAVLAQAGGGEAEDWMSNVIRRLSGLVSVRPVGLVEGEGAGAIVARAEAYLAADDLAAAVRELGALKGPPANAAAPWLAKAEARQAAERALARLARALVAQPASAGG